MIVRYPIRFMIAILFGALLIGATVCALIPTPSTTPHDYATMSDVRLGKAQVESVSDDGLITIADPAHTSCYADGFQEGDWIYYRTDRGTVTHVGTGWDDIPNA